MYVCMCVCTYSYIPGTTRQCLLPATRCPIINTVTQTIHTQIDVWREPPFACTPFACTHTYRIYGVATVSRIDKIIGLFCKRDL